MIIVEAMEIFAVQYLQQGHFFRRGRSLREEEQ